MTSAELSEDRAAETLECTIEMGGANSVSVDAADNEAEVDAADADVLNDESNAETAERCKSQSSRFISMPMARPAPPKTMAPKRTPEVRAVKNKVVQNEGATHIPVGSPRQQVCKQQEAAAGWPE